jgi:hypothetical protein
MALAIEKTDVAMDTKRRLMLEKDIREQMLY